MKTVLKIYLGIIAFFGDRKVLELRSLGMHKQGGKEFNLKEYFLDSEGQLYSRNGGTWELNPRKGYDILKCSNNTYSKGDLINTLRTIGGNKVTVRRKDLNFNSLKTETVVMLIQNADSHRKFSVMESLYV